MKDLTDGKLQETLKFAESISDDSLKLCLESLKRVEINNDIETNVYNDHSERSFYFCRLKEGKFVGNGGIIFHGNPKTGYLKNDAVQINPSFGWQIHT